MKTSVSYLLLIVAAYCTLQFNSRPVYTQQLEWVARYTGSSGYEQHINDAVTDENGNTYICGFIQIPNQIDTKDAIVLKVSSSGSITWVKLYAGADAREDEFDAIDLDISGNVYVTGGGFSSSTLTDVLTIKYDNAGNQLWMVKYDNSNDVDHGRDITVDINKNVYVTGNAYLPGPNSNYVTLKYDSNGNETWVKFFDGISNKSDFGRKLTIFEDNVIVSGLTTRDISHNDVATVKYNSSGDLLWTSIYAGDNNGGANGSTGLQTDHVGNIYFMTGIPSGPRRIVKYDTNGDSIWIKLMATGISTIALQVRQSDFFVSSNKLGDYFTSKFILNGDTLWNRVYPVQTYPSNDSPQDAIADSHGNIYVTGYCDSNWVVSDYLTVKYDSTGNLKWSKRYSQALFVDDKAYKIGIDTLDNVYVTGISGGQITTIKYSQPPVGIVNIGNEIPGEYRLYQNYPNPFNPNTKIKIEITKKEFVKLVVYDVLGRASDILVDEELNPGIYSINWNANSFSSGVYFYKIITESFTDTKKMVLSK